MARKEVTIEISDEGRDKGKAFLIREMPATKLEKWAIRAFLALAKSGVQIPPDIVARGFLGIANLGIEVLAGANFFDAEPLLDEMFGCVSIKEKAITRTPTEDDIEEVATLLKLRAEVWALHTNFSLADAKSKLISALAPARPSHHTKTSHQRSE